MTRRAVLFPLSMCLVSIGGARASPRLPQHVGFSFVQSPLQNIVGPEQRNEAAASSPAADAIGLLPFDAPILQNLIPRYGDIALHKIRSLSGKNLSGRRVNRRSAVDWDSSDATRNLDHQE